MRQKGEKKKEKKFRRSDPKEIRVWIKLEGKLHKQDMGRKRSNLSAKIGLFWLDDGTLGSGP